MRPGNFEKLRIKNACFLFSCGRKKGACIMTQSIGQKFTTFSLFRFALPSIVMMGFMSLYTIVDGIFVSQFVGSNALSSVNIVYPILNLLIAMGLMLATGGSAVVSKKFGEKKPQEARSVFSMVAAVGIAASLLLLFLTLLFAEPICYLLGSNELLIDDCRAYLCTLMFFAPACMLQSLYQSFLVTAGKPRLGLILIICAGLSNIVLDWLFIAVFHLGVSGAALATGIGQMIPAVCGSVFFLRRKSELYFTRFHLPKRLLLHICGNGSSEMVTQLSIAIITVLFNLILMKMAGPDGVAAITIILYGEFLFSSLYIGFTIGVAPIFGYAFGAQEQERLRWLHKVCSRFIVASALALTILVFLSSSYVVAAFVEPGSNTYNLAARGFAIFSITYLFIGMNIYSSGLFTALSDGITSALISFSRTFVFIVISLLVLPSLIGINGVWLAIPTAEFITAFLTLGLRRKRLPM